MSLKEAYLYDALDNGDVRCHLCPKKCLIHAGEPGFCTVRHNKEGKLYTANYGESTYFVRDTIETEGVFHYKPGIFTIEIGTYGCNLHCDFCQNWRYSRTETVTPETLVHYTPEQLVTKCQEMDIELLAWTFNDPIVWYEFVLDTSILLKKAGIKTLYKSSHFISPEALEKLADVIDVFSVSLKSIKDEFYKQYCTGWIAPVKEALLYLHGRDDCHLEISNLMIPTINDGDTEIRNFVNWILDNLSNDIPVHFVRYHPDYKFTIPRTPEEVVSKARDIALEMGLKHVYLGNSFSHAGLNTWCSKCGEELIHRHGRRCDRLPALDQSNGSCSVCGHKVENLIL